MRTSWEEEHLKQGTSWEEEHLQQGPTCEAEHLQQSQPILVADETCSLHTNSLPTNSTNARHVTADAAYYIHQRSGTTWGDGTASSLDEAGVWILGFRVEGDMVVIGRGRSDYAREHCRRDFLFVFYFFSQKLKTKLSTLRALSALLIVAGLTDVPPRCMAYI